MEFVKQGSYDGSRMQGIQKYSALQSYTTGLKSNDSSTSKNKPRKSSLTKKCKNHYLLNKKIKQTNQSQLFKTATTTKFDSTAILSCLSTPNTKSLQKTMWKKKNKLGPSDKNKITEIRTFQNKGGNLKLVLVFYLGSKVVYRQNVEKQERVDKIIKKILRQVMTSHQKFQPYYGIVGVRTKNNNFYLDSLLQKETLAQKIIEENVHEINLKIVTTKNAPSYKNLELHHFQILKYLGNGGFSTVYLARCKIDGQMCALKLIRKSSIVSEKKYQMLENEKNILFCIDHKRIVDLYYSFESKNYIIFGLQFCPNGNLFQLLQEHQMLPEEKAKFIIFQILQGMKYLHSQNILFRDLKLENILFDQNGDIKITDFGLSKPDISDEDITYSYCGSPEYMAPQMLAKSGHSFAVDYYALGIVLFELLFGRSPFYAVKKQEIFEKILNSEPNFPKFPVISKQSKSLIQGLLSKNPLRRTGSLKGVNEIMSHPWLRNYQMPFESPFKVSFSRHQINLKATETKKITQQFRRDLKKEEFQKIFFPKSFVNKVLMQNLVKNCITNQLQDIKRNTKSIDYPRIKQKR